VIRETSQGSISWADQIEKEYAAKGGFLWGAKSVPITFSLEQMPKARLICDEQNQMMALVRKAEQEGLIRLYETNREPGLSFKLPTGTTPKSSMERLRSEAILVGGVKQQPKPQEAFVEWIVIGLLAATSAAAGLAADEYGGGGSWETPQQKKERWAKRMAKWEEERLRFEQESRERQAAFDKEMAAIRQQWEARRSELAARRSVLAAWREVGARRAAIASRYGAEGYMVSTHGARGPIIIVTAALILWDLFSSTIAEDPTAANIQKNPLLLLTLDPTTAADYIMSDKDVARAVTSFNDHLKDALAAAN
jgi:hypothetical protein